MSVYRNESQLLGHDSDAMGGLAAQMDALRYSSSEDHRRLQESVQESDEMRGLAAQMYASRLMDHEVGPKKKDYDDEGFVFVADALQRMDHPLSRDSVFSFRERLTQHLREPRKYPTRDWLTEFWFFYPVTGTHQEASMSAQRVFSDQGERVQRFFEFRKKMALRLSTHFRKDELDYTLAYWRHYPLNPTDTDDTHHIFNMLYEGAQDDPRRFPDYWRPAREYRLFMALLLGAADKVPWIRDYWAFHPYCRGGDTPQVRDILQGQGGPQHYSEEVYHPRDVPDTTPEKTWRYRMLRLFTIDRADPLLMAYWKYHPFSEYSQSDQGAVDSLYKRSIYRPPTYDELIDASNKRRTTGDESAAEEFMHHAKRMMRISLEEEKTERRKEEGRLAYDLKVKERLINGGVTVFSGKSAKKK
jgi:hypothetical protein